MKAYAIRSAAAATLVSLGLASTVVWAGGLAASSANFGSSSGSSSAPAQREDPRAARQRAIISQYDHFQQQNAAMQQSIHDTFQRAAEQAARDFQQDNTVGAPDVEPPAQDYQDNSGNAYNSTPAVSPPQSEGTLRNLGGGVSVLDFSPPQPVAPAPPPAQATTPQADFGGVYDSVFPDSATSTADGDSASPVATVVSGTDLSAPTGPTVPPVVKSVGQALIDSTVDQATSGGDITDTREIAKDAIEGVPADAAWDITTSSPDAGVNAAAAVTRTVADAKLLLTYPRQVYEDLKKLGSAFTKFSNVLDNIAPSGDTDTDGSTVE